MTNLILYLAAAALGGVGLGYGGRIYIAKRNKDKFAEKQKELLLEAKDEALKIKEEAKKEEERSRRDLQELEKSLRRREEMIDRRLETVEVEKEKIVEKEKEITTIKNKLANTLCLIAYWPQGTAPRCISTKT